MHQHGRTTGAAMAVAVLSFLLTVAPASAQRLGAYYDGYRGAFYGGGNYGLGYFGSYRGSMYGGSLYGGSFSGGYIGYSPYLSRYGLGGPYTSVYPGLYRPYDTARPYGSSLYGSALPDYVFPKSSPRRPTDDTGHIVVKLPTANAELVINGNKTKQKGKSRRFVSPAIRKGKSRTYELTARWKENGTPVERSRKVKLRPGQRKVVQFKAPSS